jgi:hypothetical protein
VAFGIALCLLAAGVPVLAAEGSVPGQVTGDHRLFQAFVEDGAIVHKGWLEVAAAYAGDAKGRDLLGSITVAFRFGRDVEAGITAGLLSREREAGATLYGAEIPDSVGGTGFSDAIIYGKYRVIRSPFELAVGAAASLPLAQEEAGRGPGVFQYRTFAGARKKFSRATLVGSLGAGFRDDSRSPGGAEGRTSLRAALGVLVPIRPTWTFVGELDHESTSFGRDTPEGRVLAGLDWRPMANLGLRGALGTALTRDTPDRLAIASLFFHF